MSSNSSTNRASTTQALRRVTIHFQDDEVRRQAEATAHHLLLSAAADDADNNGNTSEMAKKALKFRKILERMAGVDVTSPDFDAAKFLDVDWCKMDSLKEYCAARGDRSKADGSRENKNV